MVRTYGGAYAWPPPKVTTPLPTIVRERRRRISGTATKDVGLRRRIRRHDEWLVRPAAGQYGAAGNPRGDGHRGEAERLLLHPGDPGKAPALRQRHGGQEESVDVVSGRDRRGIGGVLPNHRDRQRPRARVHLVRAPALPHEAVNPSTPPVQHPQHPEAAAGDERQEHGGRRRPCGRTFASGFSSVTPDRTTRYKPAVHPVIGSDGPLSKNVGRLRLARTAVAGLDIATSIVRRIWMPGKRKASPRPIMYWMLASRWVFVK